MSFEDLQSKWQSLDPGARLNIDPKLLFNEVRRNHRSMETMLWRRDLNEMSAAAVVTVVFAFVAYWIREWSLLLCAAGGLFIGLFFVVDRVKQRRLRSPADDSLSSTIEASLRQVEHQIWLLKNVLWWYLMPLAPGMIAFLVSAYWQTNKDGLAEQLVVGIVALICAVAFWQVYRVNQGAIKQMLEPRRLELEELKASLRPPTVS